MLQFQKMRLFSSLTNMSVFFLTRFHLRSVPRFAKGSRAWVASIFGFAHIILKSNDEDIYILIASPEIIMKSKYEICLYFLLAHLTGRIGLPCAIWGARGTDMRTLKKAIHLKYLESSYIVLICNLIIYISISSLGYLIWSKLP